MNIFDNSEFEEDIPMQESGFSRTRDIDGTYHYTGADAGDGWEMVASSRAFDEDEIEPLDFDDDDGFSINYGY